MSPRLGALHPIAQSGGVIELNAQAGGVLPLARQMGSGAEIPILPARSTASATAQTQPSGMPPASLIFHCEPVHVSVVGAEVALTAYTAWRLFVSDVKFMYVIWDMSEFF